MHVRCPHCHQFIQLLDDAELAHIDCPSCGSHFSLLGDSTASYFAGQGRTIGHFELIERLGVGQFGTVWSARDTELDRTVAVKIPRQEQLRREDVEMFLREARAAAQLHHPNIVSVHEVGRDGDTVFIVSDLVRGATLADWLTGQRISPREAAQLCATIGDALYHAHQSGVVHRDLKPSNIMIDADGRPHLMDFGLAVACLLFRKVSRSGRGVIHAAPRTRRHAAVVASSHAVVARAAEEIVREVPSG